MNAPKPWLRPGSDATPLERLLLSSARGDAPSSRQEAALWASLQAGGGSGNADARQPVQNDSGIAQSAGPAAGAAAVKAGSTLGVLAKPLVVGVAVTGLFLGTAKMAMRSMPDKPVAATTVVPTAPQARGMPPVTDRVGVEAGIHADQQPSLPPVRSPRSASTRATAGAPLRPTPPPPLPTTATAESISDRPEPVAQATSAIREEGRLVAEARDRIRHGDGTGGLAKLSERRATFPNGALGQEAQALEVEALAAAGQHDKARDRARAFLRAYPASPLSARMASFAY